MRTTPRSETIDARSEARLSCLFAMFGTWSQISLSELFNLDLILFGIGDSVHGIPGPLEETIQSFKRSPSCILTKLVRRPYIEVYNNWTNGLTGIAK
jgi:hypothetical protein